MEVFNQVFSLSELLRQSLYLTIQIISIIVPLLLIKGDGSSFEEHGFRQPKPLEQYLAAPLLLAVIYVLITLFLPGSLYGFKAFPFVPLFQIVSEFVPVLLTALAGEGVFRGYIQSNLKKAYGVFPALFLSSVMFSLHRFSLLSLFAPYPSAMLTDLALFFLAGIFLGFFFQKTGSLLSGVIFRSAVSILYYITPLTVAAGEFIMLPFELVGYVLILFLLYVFRFSMEK